MGSPLPWLGGLLALYLLVPIGAFVVRLGRAPGKVSGAPGLGDAVAISVQTATIAVLVIAVLGIPLAYLLARGRSRRSGLLGVLLQLPLAFPPLVSGILLLYVLGPYTPVGEFFGGRLTDDRVGIICSQVFVAAPFAVIAARSAFAALDPGWDDVAATLGHHRWARFIRVAVPAAAPGIAAGLLLAWLRAFGEFGATVILAYHPYSLPVLTYVQFGSIGLAGTLAPVGITLLAALIVLLAAAGLPRVIDRSRSSRRSQLRSSTDQSALDVVIPVESSRQAHFGPPAPGPRAALGSATGSHLSLELDALLGDFRLRLTHRAQSRTLAILGPSGSGKTLTLRLVAGLVRGGTVRFGADDMSGLPPERRDVGYLPQDPTLLPGLSVWRQATFGVDADPGVATYWIDRLQLTGLLDRRPDQLSGGQRRRVALVRALARRPRVLLLDEPSTGLDTAVRDELRRELRALQRDTALSTVLVTHDPVEAALLADEVIVLAGGEVLQAGPQPAVFSRPGSPSVARLLGVDNLGTGSVVAPGLILAGGVELAVAELTAPVGAEVSWGIRSSAIRVAAEVTGDSYAATVLDAVEFGADRELSVAVGELQLTVRTRVEVAPGASCRLTLPPPDILTWPLKRTFRSEGFAD